MQASYDLAILRAIIGPRIEAKVEAAALRGQEVERQLSFTNEDSLP